MLIGYARISTDDQNLALQHDALAAAGCETIYEDQGSRMSVADDEPEHVVVVPGGLLAPAA